MHARHERAFNYLATALGSESTNSKVERLRQNEAAHTLLVHPAQVPERRACGMRQFLLVALITLPVLARAGKARRNKSIRTATKVSRRQEFIFVIAQPFDIRDSQAQDSGERRSQLPADARPGTKQERTIQAFQAQQKKQSVSDRSFSPEPAKVRGYRSHSRVDQDGRCASLQTAPSSAHGEGATLLEAPGDHQSVPRHPRRKMHLGAGRKRQARSGLQIGQQMRLLQRREVRKDDMETHYLSLLQPNDRQEALRSIAIHGGEAMSVDYRARLRRVLHRRNPSRPKRKPRGKYSKDKGSKQKKMSEYRPRGVEDLKATQQEMDF